MPKIIISGVRSEIEGNFKSCGNINTGFNPWIPSSIFHATNGNVVLSIVKSD